MYIISHIYNITPLSQHIKPKIKLLINTKHKEDKKAHFVKKDNYH